MSPRVADTTEVSTSTAGGEQPMRVVRRRRPLGGVAPVAAVVVFVAACGGEPAVVESQAESCVSWVSYETPADAMADAVVVVRTEGPMTAVATTELFGAEANVLLVPVHHVHKGTDVSVGQDLEVTSTPVTCSGGEVYPEGDPLDATGTLILFLFWDEALPGWRTITPLQGVVSTTSDGEVPSEWPDT
jgi:FlaG/FlaF family flagellin (archaellin)